MNGKLVTFGLAIVFATVVIAKTTSAEEERTVEISAGDEVPLTTAGLKQAFQVQCQRQVPLESWSCGEAESSGIFVLPRISVWGQRHTGIERVI